jgi:CO/xanthine dehydrogenase Mo-binding subunit
MKRSEFGGHRNLTPAYAFERLQTVRHFASNSPLRVSAMRSLGAYANVFAIESFMDELALEARIDPVEFRLKHLNDERAIAVVKIAAEKSNWEVRTRPNNSGKGRGFAYAQYKNKQSYTAIVVDVTVNMETGEIKLDKALIAADTGQIVNPDGTSNQFEGGFVQAASWTLYEQVNYDDNGITSLDWETYPILHFENAPEIEIILLNRPDQPTLGAGESTQNPTPAAIANAIFDALGVRIRDLPLTPEKVLKALQEK